MKCVCCIPTEGVCRVSDEEAARLVGHGEMGEQGWKYVSKQDWKDTGRMTTIQQAEDYVEPKQQKTVLVKEPMGDMSGEAMRELASKVEPVVKNKKPKYKKGLSGNKPATGKNIKGVTRTRAIKQKNGKD